MAKLISRTYGEALFAQAADTGKVDELYPPMQMIRLLLQPLCLIKYMSMTD